MSEIIAMYADGGTILRNPSLHGFTWAWCTVDAAGQRLIELSGAEAWRGATNNLAEYYALLRGLEALPAGWSGRVYSDSGVTLGRFFQGWRCQGIPTNWIVRSNHVLHGHLGACTPVQLDGHPTQRQLVAGLGKRGNPVSAHNQWADAACRAAAAAYLARLGTKMA